MKANTQLKEPLRESLWVSKHQKELQKYAGKWIAVFRNRVIAVGNSVKEVMLKAKEKGISLPLVIKVPRADEGNYVL